MMGKKITLRLKTASLPPISSEQQHIISLVKDGFNVCVDAVAGSGKTTTSLYLAFNNSLKSILLLTYNAKLKLETRSKLQEAHIENMEVHSYHSFCVKYFYRRSYTDAGIIEFLKQHNFNDILKSFSYDLVIIDEAQDMNPVYYEVINHILIRLSKQPQLIVMGDQKQAIYAFNNADSRFLSQAPQIFPVGASWKQTTLSTSYRMTGETALFINQCCQGSPQINTVKYGPLVKYLICDAFGSRPLSEVNSYLRQGYNYQDIFILTPSVKSEKSPVRHLANKLSKACIPIYVPTSDEEKLDEDVLAGKIVFSTYHQVKGLERPIVLVFNFDNSYFTYYARDIPPTDYHLIPNTLYVAITRAKHQLVLIHHEENNFLQFIKNSYIHRFCQLEMSSHFRPSSSSVSRHTKIKDLAVTDLVKYVPIEVLDQCMSLLNIEKGHGPDQSNEKLSIPFKVKQDNLYEGVSEITGSAIPCYYEYHISGRMTLYDYLVTNQIKEIDIYLKELQNIGVKCAFSSDDESPKDSRDQAVYRDLYKKLTATQEIDTNACQALLHLTNHWVCQKNGYDFKKRQIKQYDWLSTETLTAAINRLNCLFSTTNHESLQFEKPLMVPYHQYLLIGFADIYDSEHRRLWELKVVNEVDHTHLLQTAVYLWMLHQMKEVEGSTVEASVYNIMNNRYYRINTRLSHLDQIIEILIKYKDVGVSKTNLQQFLHKCEKIRNVFTSEHPHNDPQTTDKKL